MTTIDLETLELHSGSHSPDGVMCLLEAVSQFNNEPWSDSPASVSPVLAAYGRSWNDGMRSNEERASLKQYIPLLVGTAGNPAADEQRSWIALDWLVRVHTVAWLRLAGGSCATHAAALAALPAIMNSDLAQSAQPAIDAAWDAARAAAGDAWDAAWAARAAAWAAGAAARDAWDAAGDARAAAWAAARAAAGDAGAARAAGAALEPIVIELQASAHDLFRRMIAADGTPSAWEKAR